MSTAEGRDVLLVPADPVQQVGTHRAAVLDRADRGPLLAASPPWKSHPWASSRRLGPVSRANISGVLPLDDPDPLERAARDPRGVESDLVQQVVALAVVDPG